MISSLCSLPRSRLRDPPNAHSAQLHRQQAWRTHVSGASQLCARPAQWGECGRRADMALRPSWPPLRGHHPPHPAGMPMLRTDTPKTRTAALGLTVLNAWPYVGGGPVGPSTVGIQRFWAPTAFPARYPRASGSRAALPIHTSGAVQADCMQEGRAKLRNFRTGRSARGPTADGPSPGCCRTDKRSRAQGPSFRTGAGRVMETHGTGVFTSR
jgi:hypothetical protein